MNGKKRQPHAKLDETVESLKNTQFPEAGDTGIPLITSTGFLIIPQHLQFAWPKKGVVIPKLCTKANDFSTESLLAIFEHVYLTNLKHGFFKSLKVSIFRI